VDGDCVGEYVHNNTRKYSLSLSLKEVLSFSIPSVGLLLVYVLILFTPEEGQSLLTAPLVLFSIFFSLAWCLPVARRNSESRLDWFHPAISGSAGILCLFSISRRLALACTRQ
jgi:hypothetical protein